VEGNNIDIVKELIRKEFSFLEELGYKPVFKVLHDKPFIEGAEIKYSDPERKREVRISYTKAKVYEDIKYTFGASITRIPYSDITDFFSLRIYLESMSRDFSRSMVNHFDEIEAAVIVKKIASALKTYAPDIISGTSWLDKYWPDW